MLSKEVKLRRRIKRETRKQPAWRTCMRMLKFQQATLLKMQRNGLVGKAGMPLNSVTDLKAMHENLDKSRQIMRQLQRMTREEFYAEVKKEGSNYAIPGRMRSWAELITSGRVDRDIEDKKQMKKFRRMYRQQVLRKMPHESV